MLNIFLGNETENLLLVDEFSPKILGTCQLRLIHDQGGKLFVIKELRDLEKAERFLLEAWLLKQASKLTDVIPAGFYTETGKTYPLIIMPYISGGNLKRSLRDKAFSLKEIINLFKIISSSIYKIHCENILHLDIKSSNILLDDHRKPLIIDFGMAIPINSLQDLIPPCLQPVLQYRLKNKAGGTWEYMAPEQFNKISAELTAAADLYSLGISLYEAITGKLPYQSRIEDLEQRRMDLETQHQSGNFPRLKVNDLIETYNIEYNLNRLLEKLINPNPGERCTSAQNLLNEFIKIEEIL